MCLSSSYTDFLVTVCGSLNKMALIGHLLTCLVLTEVSVLSGPTAI